MATASVELKRGEVLSPAGVIAPCRCGHGAWWYRDAEHACVGCGGCGQRTDTYPTLTQAISHWHAGDTHYDE